MSTPRSWTLNRKAWYAIAAVLALFLGLCALVAADNCSVRRSVRFAPAEGLRVLKAIDKTRLPRLPWSSDPVPQLYELTTAHYRIVFETPEDQDGLIPPLFIESATAGGEDVLVEGNRIIGPHDRFYRYHVAVTDRDFNALVFAVKDQDGNVLGEHTLQYFLEGYSYYCNRFQGI